MNRQTALALALAGIATAGCTESSNEVTTVIGTTAIYSPSDGAIPLPNDLLYSGTTDGTLNAPDPADPALQPIFDALNGLDGWSPIAPFSIPFSGMLDPTTIIAGTTVRFFEVTRLVNEDFPVGGPVTSVTAELDGTFIDPLTGLPDDLTADYVATISPDGGSIAMLPLKPLKASTTYMVNVLDGIRDMDDVAVMRSIVYQLASDETPVEDDDPLAPLQNVILSMHGAAESQGIDPDNILVSQQFTTQSIGNVLSNINAIANGGEQAVIDAVCLANEALICDDTTPDPNSAISIDNAGWNFIGDTGAVAGSPLNAANIYQGSLTLPYYLEDATPGGAGATDTSSDPTPLSTRWAARFALGATDTERHLTFLNPLPRAFEQETVPVLMTLPKTLPPASGYPIVVFQHGITSNRTALLGIADALASAGYAAVSIDLPLHGLPAPDIATPSLSDVLFTSFQDDVVRERTFGLDFADNDDPLSATPDGLADSSGTYFINLNSLLTSRDNLRQAEADLMALFTVLDDVNFDASAQGLGTVTFDADPLNTSIHFIGHSLGGIVGTAALSYLPQVTSATIGMPGGGIAKLLSNSETFGPAIVAGLAAATGLDPATPEFAAVLEQFLFAAQQAADSGDPLNYAEQLATLGTPLHLIEVVGEVGFSDPDDVIPNSVPTAPLAGTEPLISALGLTSILDDTVDAAGIRGAVRFIRGGHASLLLPDDSLEAFTEMQAQTVEFMLTDGQSLTITDDTVVLTAP